MQQKATLLMATRLPFKFPCLAGNLTATWAKCRPWNLIRLHTALITLRHTYSTPPFLSYLLSLKTRQVIQGMACNCNTSILSTLSPSQHSPWAGELKSGVDTAAGARTSEYLRPELRAGCFQFICKTSRLMKLSRNVTAQ